MAKSKSTKTGHVTRDTVVVASPARRLRYTSSYSPLSSLSTSFTQRFAPLYLFQDGRTYHPAGRNRPDIAVPRSAAQLVMRPANVRGKTARNWFGQPLIGTDGTIGFKAPRKVATCVRRHRRREVLFARGHSGAGNRKPRWKASSHISCKA